MAEVEFSSVNQRRPKITLIDSRCRLCLTDSPDMNLFCTSLVEASLYWWVLVLVCYVWGWVC